MFDSDEWSRLVDRLASVTAKDKLHWEQSDDDTVLAEVGKIQYEIGSVDGDGRQPFYLAVVDQSDPWSRKELARLVSEPQGSYLDAPPGARLIELRRLALRNAIGAPQLLEELLGGLASEEADEEPPF